MYQCSLLEAILFCLGQANCGFLFWVSAKARLGQAVAVYRASQQQKKFAFGGIKKSKLENIKSRGYGNKRDGFSLAN